MADSGENNVSGPDLREKRKKLEATILGFESALLAFSGGLDSTLLAKVARELLGDKAVAFTAETVLIPRGETEEARDIARSIGIRHIVKEINPLLEPLVRSNPRERCYYCKRLIYREAREEARKLGIPTVMDGTTAEDARGTRPGLLAIRELDIKTPLNAAGLIREDIRALSREYGLPTWNKSSQSCLATRIPYGNDLDADILRRLDECERTLKEFGFSPVRARLHGTVLRIEVAPDEVARLVSSEARSLVVEKCRALGFPYVTVDLEGFASGSMDRA